MWIFMAILMDIITLSIGSFYFIPLLMLTVLLLLHTNLNKGF